MKKTKPGREDLDDAAYTNGSERAWLTMLGEAMKHLGYEHPAVQASKWAVERADTIIALRRICADHGDVDWDESLYLVDIIEKHLAPYLVCEASTDSRPSSPGLNGGTDR